MVRIRQLPRVTDTDALPSLSSLGEEDPLTCDCALSGAGILDLLIDVRRLEIMVLLDMRSADCYLGSNAALLVGRSFHDLVFPRHPNARPPSPIGSPMGCNRMRRLEDGIQLEISVEYVGDWDFSFTAPRLQFFLLNVPHIIDPLPSYGYPGDVSEEIIEDNLPTWDTDATIIAYSETGPHPRSARGTLRHIVRSLLPHNRKA